MPCRALEAFGRLIGRRGLRFGAGAVLMPCRALEAFGLPITDSKGLSHPIGLNALSGIGGVRTNGVFRISSVAQYISLNALSGIGGVRTKSSSVTALSR